MAEYAAIDGFVERLWLSQYAAEHPRNSVEYR